MKNPLIAILVSGLGCLALWFTIRAAYQATRPKISPPTTSPQLAVEPEWDGMHSVIATFDQAGNTTLSGWVCKGGKCGASMMPVPRQAWRGAVGQQVENEMVARWVPDCITAVSVDDDKPLVQCNGGGCCTAAEIEQAKQMRAKTHPVEKVTR